MRYKSSKGGNHNYYYYKINKIKEFKWFFFDLSDLVTRLPIGGAGNFAIVDNSIYIWDTTTEAWIENSGGGGGTPDTYTNAVPTSTTLWGIASWSTFAAQTMTQMWDALLYPYQLPAFSSFSFWWTTPIEVGTTISWNKTFTWWASNPTNIEVDSIDIQDITWSVNLATWLTNDWSEVLDIGTIQKTSATSHTWRITGTNTNSSTFTRNYTITWQWKKFYWESVSSGPLVEADIEALRINTLSTWFAWTYSFLAGWYKYIAYPTTFGTASTFKDQSTNLDIPMLASYTVDLTNAGWVTQTYRVHRTTNIMGSAINIVVS